MDAVRAESLASALARTLELSLVDGDWRVALSCFAEAAGAGGAVLIRERPTGRSVALSTDTIAEPVTDYVAGRAPPDLRAARVMPRVSSGFVTDLDCFSRDELQRDVFYAEFLRPLGFGWHACALVGEEPDGEKLYLSLKRPFRAGHYERAEIALLNAALPGLRRARALSEARFRVQTGAACEALAKPGRGLFQLGFDGRVRQFDDGAAALVESDLVILRGRLCTRSPGEQGRIDRALAAAMLPPARTSLAVLTTADPGRRLILRVIALGGEARAVFGAAGFLATVETLQLPLEAPAELVGALREAFALTPMQARVTALVASGVSLANAAVMLAIAEGTVRNHLKAGMSKANVTRQAELAVLAARLER